MVDIKAGEPFGLDESELSKIDWKLALGRVLDDLPTDFIYAPHLRFIYEKAGDLLITRLSSELGSGKFSPGLPITIEVPKSNRVRLSGLPGVIGPTFSRPGSILLPGDRLFYQALADRAATIVEDKTDNSRSFSHRIAPQGSERLFLPSWTCWKEFQNAISKNSNSKNYVLKVDVANCYGSLNQHTMINVLSDSGYPKALASRLEAIFTSHTGDRSSRGILQGICPSDLFGNFYLAPIDQFFDDHGVISVRYVDDFYVFVDSTDAASNVLGDLIPTLREYDLVINEAKAEIVPGPAVLIEEPHLEALFNQAVEELSSQTDENESNDGYGFQAEWEDDDPEAEEEQVDAEELVLDATMVLFDSIYEFPGREEGIERFCLSVFSRAKSTYAVVYVFESFRKRPSMSQRYAAYLSNFLETDGVEDFLSELLEDPHLSDWQRMWVLGALSQVKSADDTIVKVALKLLKDANRHDALRAVAAIFVGRFGNHARRKTLIKIHNEPVSNYIQAGIYFSSRVWPGVERSKARAAWGGQSPLHKLLTVAIGNK